MPIPIIVIVQALAAGGTLVPHAAGGLIVTGAAGYITSTYISTAALASYLAGVGITAAVSLGTILSISGILGSAGFMGSTIGATGITGWLMGLGILPATPIWLPILTVFSIVGLPILFAWSIYKYRKTVNRVLSASDAEELIFSKTEARMVQKILLLTHSKQKES